MRLILGDTELAVLSKAGAIALGRGGGSVGSNFAERPPSERAPRLPVGFVLSVLDIFSTTVLGGARG